MKIASIEERTDVFYDVTFEREPYYGDAKSYIRVNSGLWLSWGSGDLRMVRAPEELEAAFQKEMASP